MWPNRRCSAACNSLTPAFVIPVPDKSSHWRAVSFASDGKPASLMGVAEVAPKFVHSYFFPDLRAAWEMEKRGARGKFWESYTGRSAQKARACSWVTRARLSFNST